jgi:c-di-GMP-binding flagellar brake protein YcgR
LQIQGYSYFRNNRSFSSDIFESGEAMFVSIGALKVQLRQMGRREARRYPLNWAVKVTINAPPDEIVEFSGTVRDLSATGVFVYLRTSLEIGNEVLVSIRLPFEKETWMNLPGTVIRVAKRTERRGVAIKFKQTRPQFVTRPLEV